MEMESVEEAPPTSAPASASASAPSMIASATAEIESMKRNIVTQEWFDQKVKETCAAAEIEAKATIARLESESDLDYFDFADRLGITFQVPECIAEHVEDPGDADPWVLMDGKFQETTGCSIAGAAYLVTLCENDFSEAFKHEEDGIYIRLSSVTRCYKFLDSEFGNIMLDNYLTEQRLSVQYYLYRKSKTVPV